MLETQRYFVGAASGEQVSPSARTPPELLCDGPIADFARTRSEVIETFAQVAECLPDSSDRGYAASVAVYLYSMRGRYMKAAIWGDRQVEYQ